MRVVREAGEGGVCVGELREAREHTTTVPTGCGVGGRGVDSKGECV